MTYELGTGNSSQIIPKKRDYSKPETLSIETPGLTPSRGYMPGTDSKVVAGAEIYVIHNDLDGYRAMVIEGDKEPDLLRAECASELWNDAINGLNGRKDLPIILGLDYYVPSESKSLLIGLVRDHNEERGLKRP